MTIVMAFIALERAQVDGPGRDDLVLVEKRAASSIAPRIALLDALEAAVAAARAGVEGQDRVARDDEAPAQRADGGVGARPVRRARACGEGLDLVAVVRDAGRVAPQAQDGLEQPPAGLVTDRGFSRGGEFRSAGVAVFAFRAPGAFREEKGMGYPCILTESSGACERSSSE